MASARDILSKHRIAFVATKSGKFTTGCPNCGGEGYLNVVIERDGCAWYCHQCEQGSGEKFEQPAAPIHPKGDLGPIRAVYDYTDESGKLLMQTVRYEPPGRPKVFRQRRSPDQQKWSVKGVRMVPYRLPELLADIEAGHVVIVCEGEKDADNLRSAGVPATTNPMGAGKWWPEFNVLLRGADVVIVGDNDVPGALHVRLVAASLKGSAKRIRVLDLAKVWPQIEPSGDVSDYLECHSVDDLWREIEQLPDHKPTNGNGAHHGEAVVIQVPTESRLPPILSHAQFVADFVPPDYLIDGVLQRRFLYALTGLTGHAKTAVALLLARLVSSSDLNATLKRHRVEKGRVVYFVGENPDDVRMRVICANAKRTDDPRSDNIWFIPGVFKITEMMPVLAEDCRVHGAISMIVIDTSAAYFLGKEELSNTEMLAYAKTLRALTTLPGGPCVLVLCHPIKHVEEADKLLPRGGSAYLNEMDGNLTLWRKADDMVELSYTKMRGPGFEPITFRIETIRDKKLVDQKGREIPTVQAVAIEDAEEDRRTNSARTDQDRVLVNMLGLPEASIADWAKACGWVSDSGEPHKSKVHRIVTALSIHPPRLTKKVRGSWQLTEDGKDVARKAALQFRRDDEAEAERRAQSKLL